MGLFYRLTLQDACDEGRREGVAGAYSVGNLHFRCGLERNLSRCEDVAAVDAARQDEHLQVVFAQKNPAFVLQVDAGSPSPVPRR